MRRFCAGMGLRGSAGGTGIALRSCVVMLSPTSISTSKADASQQNKLRSKKKRRITPRLSAALPITLLAQYSIKVQHQKLDRLDNIGYSGWGLQAKIRYAFVPVCRCGGTMSITSQAQQTADATPGDLHDYLVSLIKQAAATYIAQEQITCDIEQLTIGLRFSAQASFGDYSIPLMS